MATTVPLDTPLRALDDETRTIGEWTTTFHLALVVLDPYTNESSWIIDTALRILDHFADADCRTAFVLATDDSGAKRFLGPLVDEVLIFTDADRTLISAIELETLPAFVHLNQAGGVDSAAQGWDPAAWKQAAEELAAAMDCHVPEIPAANDPAPFAGTPARVVDDQSVAG